MKKTVYVLAGLLFLLSGAAAPAQEPAQGERHASVRFLPVRTATGIAATQPVMVEITLDKGWKAYWRTPGEAGLAPSFDWSGSDNLRNARVLWPAPHRFTAFDIDNYGYKDKVVFPVDADVVQPAAALSLRLKLDLLVCSDICLPEVHTAVLAIPAGRNPEFIAAHKEIYDAALRRVPRKEDRFFISAYLNYDTSNRNYLVVEARADTPPARGADLFIEHESGLSFGAPYIDYKDGKITFTAPVRDADTFAQVAGKLERGKITFTYTGGEGGVEGFAYLSPRPARVEAPLPTPGIAPRVALGTTAVSIALAAFLGGLILNLMPCVLPVLSLKILSVVSHGGKDSRRDIFLNFMASALGILFSFWLMAGALAAFKAAGATIGWGIQFQHPGFLVFLITVVSLFAANLWGLFDIPLPRFIARNIPARHEHDPTMLGHFLTGAFATLLATPCTAPFLGTAVGFALARETAEIFSIFTMIGLGLAFPYILLAVSPRLFRYMPRPGAWMTKLKKVLALALALTALWLASVLMTILSTPALDRGWEKFDAALIAPAVEEGRIVVVDVTADWCLTCKANKRLVLETREVEEALSQPEILRLQADWTQRDEDIAAYLRSFGRYGIPFNVVYGPAAPQGIPLPELLTKKDVLGAIHEAAGE